MEKIQLHSVLPKVFAQRNDLNSEIWKQDVTFEKGHLYLIEAESGSGKSTFCSYVLGYRHDYSGSVMFDNDVTANYKVKDWVEMRKRHISHLFQELRLFPELTALENVEIKNKITGFKTREQILKWFDMLGIADKVDAQMGVNGVNVLNSELFFESVPDGFVDVPLKDWKYTPGTQEVPIILPRTYINMYNFGFAQSHSLPKISDGLMGMIDFNIQIQAGGKKEQFKGKVIGFSSRLNTILVPQAFMDWSNQEFAPNQKSDPNRLIVEVGNPGDENITKYLDDNGYEVETDKLDAEKTTYFLRMMVSMVMIIGLVISVLSFYILMLSIYLLVQKNSSKLENLLLIGYSPNNVAKPYQVLTIALNIVVLIIAWIILFFLRDYYMGFIETLFPDIDEGTMLPAIALGLLLFLIVSILNIVAIRRKVMSIWQRKE